MDLLFISLLITTIIITIITITITIIITVGDWRPARAGAEFIAFATFVTFPQSVRINYFCSGPISVDPICPQPSGLAAGDWHSARARKRLS